MTPWPQAEPSGKGQDWHTKATFSEIPLTRGGKPWKAPLLLHLITTGRSHLCLGELLSHLSPWRSDFLRRATFTAVFPCSSQGPAQQCVYHHPFLPEPTARPLSCLARLPSTLRPCGLPVIQHDGELAGGGRRGGQVCLVCVCGMPRPHSSERPRKPCPRPSPSAALGSSAPNPGKRVVGDDLHPLGLRAAKHNLMSSLLGCTFPASGSPSGEQGSPGTVSSPSSSPLAMLSPPRHHCCRLMRLVSAGLGKPVTLRPHTFV